MHASHAADALVPQRLESSEPSAEYSVDARPAENDFAVESVLEGFMDKHSGKANLASAYIELVWDRVSVWSRFRV